MSYQYSLRAIDPVNSSSHNFGQIVLSSWKTSCSVFLTKPLSDSRSHICCATVAASESAGENSNKHLSEFHKSTIVPTDYSDPNALLAAMLHPC
jgi:hypothetical protein